MFPTIRSVTADLETTDEYDIHTKSMRGMELSLSLQQS